MTHVSQKPSLYTLSAKTCCVSKNSLWGLNKRCWVSKICCLSKNRPIEQNMLCHQKLISPQKFLVITQQKYAVWANIWWVSNMSSFSKNTLWQHARHCSSLWRTNHTLATVCRQPPPRNSRAYGTAADGTQGIGLGFYTRFSLCADSCRLRRRRSRRATASRRIALHSANFCWISWFLVRQQILLTQHLCWVLTRHFADSASFCWQSVFFCWTSSFLLTCQFFVDTAYFCWFGWFWLKQQIFVYSAYFVTV